MKPRRGASLVEILVVMAIIGLLLALLLPAIAKVRGTMLRLQSSNNLKQIMTAMHQFAAENGDRFPSRHEKLGDYLGSLFFAILPYIDEQLTAAILTRNASYGTMHRVKAFIDPADWSVSNLPEGGFCSYAENGQVFKVRPKLPGSFNDGMGNTIAFGQHLGTIRKPSKYVDFDWAEDTTRTIHYPYPPEGRFPSYVIRNASFAEFEPLYGPYDPAIDDVYPITKNGVTTGSIPGLFFQYRPTLEDADPRICQGYHSGGMLVAMADGSVRMMAPTIQSNIYWSLVTPNGGESVSDDW
jgi:prepilin-type N-terminal cleavage/methylation domain-containing protein/prepilin-type processing-associated H-X9-DG protein